MSRPAQILSGYEQKMQRAATVSEQSFPVHQCHPRYPSKIDC